MNTYYHNFEIGFNYWYLALPMMMLVMGLVGSFRYQLMADGKIRKKGRGFTILIKAAAMALSVFMVFFMMAESAMGLLQLFANALGKEEDIAWAIFSATFALMVLLVAIYLIFLCCAKIGQWAKLGYLIEKKRQRRKLEVELVDEADEDLTETPEEEVVATLDEEASSNGLVEARSKGIDIPEYLKPYIALTKPIDKSAWKKVVDFPINRES